LIRYEKGQFTLVQKIEVAGHVVDLSIHQKRHEVSIYTDQSLYCVYTLQEEKLVPRCDDIIQHISKTVFAEQGKCSFFFVVFEGDNMIDIHTLIDVWEVPITTFNWKTLHKQPKTGFLDLCSIQEASSTVSAQKKSLSKKTFWSLKRQEWLLRHDGPSH
jgi:hypothetical protein